MTNSGDLDGEFTYLYNGHQIIEVRNGSDDVELLVVHAEADQGGRAKGYIDEIVCQRVKDRGWAYVLPWSVNYGYLAKSNLRHYLGRAAGSRWPAVLAAGQAVSVAGLSRFYWILTRDRLGMRVDSRRVAWTRTELT